jgi:two-component system response regulator AtoC
VNTKGQVLVREDFQEFPEDAGKQPLTEKRSEPVSKPGTWLSLDEVEENHIRKVIRESGHKTKGEICEILGISRPTFERKLEKYKISLERE